MSDGDFQVPIYNRDVSFDVPIIFEEEITPIEYYWLMKQVEEEYQLEEYLKDYAGELCEL